MNPEVFSAMQLTHQLQGTEHGQPKVTLLMYFYCTAYFLLGLLATRALPPFGLSPTLGLARGLPKALRRL